MTSAESASGNIDFERTLIKIGISVPDAQGSIGLAPL